MPNRYLFESIFSLRAARCALWAAEYAAMSFQCYRQRMGNAKKRGTVTRAKASGAAVRAKATKQTIAKKNGKAAQVPKARIRSPGYMHIDFQWYQTEASHATGEQWFRQAQDSGKEDQEEGPKGRGPGMMSVSTHM